MATFRNELKHICKKRGMTLADLAKKIGYTPNLMSVCGTKKGISYQTLNKIIKVLKLENMDKLALRHSAKFTRSRQGLVIDDDFIDAVTYELIANDAYWEDYKEICKAVLKFAGVKSKVK